MRGVALTVAVLTAVVPIGLVDAASAAKRTTRATTRRSTRRTTRTTATPVPRTTAPQRDAPTTRPTQATKPAPRRPPALVWTACGGGFECATLSVPLSYDDPNGSQIAIAVQRLPTDPLRRLGSLVVNPGGPGGSGLTFLRAAAGSLLAPDGRERFDLVSFDPRGVGDSTPLPCGSAQDRSATSGADYARALHEACVTRAAALTASITTNATARDMEQLRVALGDERLNYLGISYGTYLGLVYADLFPERVGRFVIDSAVDPTVRAIELTVQQIGQYETNLRRVLATCTSRCPFADPDVPARLLRLLARVDASPLSVGSITLDRRALELLVLTLSKSSPNTMFAMLADIDRGDASIVPAILRALDNRIPEPPNFEDLTSSDAVYLQVACAEGFHPSASPDITTLAAQVGAVAPTFVKIAAGRATPVCAGWGTAVESRPQPIARPGIAPMLFVGSLNDEVTPFAWTSAVSQRWPGSALLRVAGARHGAVPSDACAAQVASAFLLDGTLPPAATLCP